MAKIGHELQNNDNVDPASLRSNAPEAQLRLGGEVSPPAPTLEEDPSEYKSPKRTDRVEKSKANLKQTMGLDPVTAVSFTESASSARRLLGETNARRMAAQYAEGSEQRAAEEAKIIHSPNTEGLIELFRDIPPKEPTESSNN